jgi:hypothetical protein
MRWKQINWPVLVAALVLLVGFFVPWIRIPDGDSEQIVSGASMGVVADELGGAYYVVYLLPLFAIAMGVAAVKKPSWASMISIVVGVSLLVWGLFELARFLFLQTRWGLWVTAVGAMLAAFGGALTWRRAHLLVAQAKAAAKAAKETPTGPDSP